MKARRIPVLLLCMLCSAACSQPPQPQSPVLLRLAGSTSMQPLALALTDAYSQRHTHVSFEYTAVGSTGGLELLRRGQTDLALVSRSLSMEEQVDVSSGKASLFPTLVAWDAIAIAVHPDNPLREISLYQLRSVFGGQISNWDALGGSQGEILVVSREDGSGTRTAFEQTVMRGHAVTSTAVVMPGSMPLQSFIASNPAAIGYLSMGWLGDGVVRLAVDGVAPSRNSIEQATYPFVRPFLLVYRDTPPTGVAEFLSFATSPAGQAIVRTSYGGAGSQRH